MGLLKYQAIHACVAHDGVLCTLSNRSAPDRGKWSGPSGKAAFCKCFEGKIFLRMGPLISGWNSGKVRKWRQVVTRRKEEEGYRQCRQACAESVRGSGRDSGTKRDVEEWKEDGMAREGKEMKHAIHEGKSRLEQR
jgi:hypothetical protein